MKHWNQFFAFAISLTCALASPAAGAAGPTLYGVLNLSIDDLDNGTDSALNISSNSSRLGVKGDIQVNDALTGIYQIESELRADDSTGGTLATRNTFVGLQGGYGTLRLGRLDTPVKALGRAVDLFADQVGDARNLTRGANNNLSRFDERPTNSLDYATPEWAGFKGAILYSTNNDATVTATNDNDLISAAVNYARGPALVGFGYETAGNTDATQDDPSVLRLAGYYDLGDAWRFIGFWQTVSGTIADNDEDVYGLGARYRSGGWMYKFQLYQLTADADDMDASLIALGAEYMLQKGFTLYADYAATDNDDNRSLTPYAQGHGDNLVAATGDAAKAVSFGAIFKF